MKLRLMRAIISIGAGLVAGIAAMPAAAVNVYTARGRTDSGRIPDA
jgi:hypothetical protein